MTRTKVTMTPVFNVDSIAVLGDGRDALRRALRRLRRHGFCAGLGALALGAGCSSVPSEPRDGDPATPNAGAAALSGGGGATVGGATAGGGFDAGGAVAGTAPSLGGTANSAGTAGSGGESGRPASAGGGAGGGAGAAGTLIDVDLTKGDAGPGMVTGGVWAGGWRMTAAMDRIVYDAGAFVTTGSFKASFTINKNPSQLSGKRNWLGAYEDASLNQGALVGPSSWFYARTGESKYGFSRLKAYYMAPDHTEWEETIGTPNEWIADDTTTMSVTWTWQPGRVVFTDTLGAAYDCGGPCLKFTGVRYFFLGSDNYFGGEGGPVGIRFVHVAIEAR